VHHKWSPPFVVYAAGGTPAASQLLLRSKTKEGILVWVVDSGTPPDMPPVVSCNRRLQNKIKVSFV